jgi:hypothetical protein
MQRGKSKGWMILVHSAICATVLAGTLLTPSLMLRVRPGQRSWLTLSVSAVLMFLAVMIVLSRKGLAMLRPMTLLPVVLGLAFLVKNASPVIDASQSARPMAKFLAGLGVGAGDHVAFFQVRREIAYGLGFYRNRAPEVYAGWPVLDPVEAGPSGAPSTGVFYVVARERSASSDPEEQLRQQLPGREIQTIGWYRPQRLQVLAVAPADAKPAPAGGSGR